MSFERTKLIVSLIDWSNHNSIYLSIAKRAKKKFKVNFKIEKEQKINSKYARIEHIEVAYVLFSFFVKLWF